MAGIYIHIPYCRQKCSYCNFHFSTNLKSKEELLAAMKLEISQMKNFLDGEQIDTVYFGGGTPSLLTIQELENLILHLNSTFDLSQVREYTLEANPDDLTEEYLYQLKNYSPINRLSIGIQSFEDYDLKEMNRAHNSAMAKSSLEISAKIGFSSLNADLIFALPWQKNDDYIYSNIDLLSTYLVDHISCYQLTIEPQTLLYNKVKKGLVKENADESTLRQFSLIREILKEKGFEQYEISNYCKDEKFALHNTSYWQRSTYLGIGPSAHSFKGNMRYWNIDNNALYINALKDSLPYFESEELSSVQIANEIIMTGLRTKWGIDYKHIESIDQNLNFTEFDKNIDILTESGMLQKEKDTIKLTDTGKPLCDSISVQLFFDEE